MLIAFISANPETPYHITRLGLISPLHFHILSRYRGVKHTQCTKVYSGVMFSSRKKMFPNMHLPRYRIFWPGNRIFFLYPRFSLFSLIQMHSAYLKLPSWVYNSYWKWAPFWMSLLIFMKESNHLIKIISFKIHLNKLGYLKYSFQYFIWLRMKWSPYVNL